MFRKAVIQDVSMEYLWMGIDYREGESDLKLRDQLSNFAINI